MLKNGLRVQVGFGHVIKNRQIADYVNAVRISWYEHEILALDFSAVGPVTPTKISSTHFAWERSWQTSCGR